MSNSPYIKILLQKFILNQCNAEEIKEVAEYFKKNQLTDDFPTVDEVKELLGNMPLMDTATAHSIFTNITVQNKRPISINRKRGSYKKYISIAASVVVLLTVGLVYQIRSNNHKESLPLLKGNEITIQLENGDIQVLTETGQAALTDANGNVVGNQKGSKIKYDTNTSIENLVYNTIKIPYGKRFQLQLSDGTIVHLNAGTTLRYPVRFIAGQERLVFLDGEAYFDVAKDKKHPFVVNAGNLNVRALGTHFNVSSYDDDDLTDVVLEEGSVALYTKNQKFDALKNTVLKPGYKGSFAKKDSSIDVKSVSTDVYTSWIYGELYFRNMSFKNIAKKLERHYNVTIHNQNQKLANEKFNASFKQQPIGVVLSYFNDIQRINYTIKDDTITIK
ncbi:DUF4974 domain-containing protein [Flavobacterium zepuense]|uniref:DUF4974 domain-containing protein n=1 Tax=Flavobacterium zepuense TaxID=2593302 RepID=A0A552VAH1_9FLAO|nr:FecR family protein [Flavobacterium zepuense]TRW27476.1 DUF4974 domain-containing protein [Flavobacterium zepuense]